MIFSALRAAAVRAWPHAERTDVRRAAALLAMPWVWAYVVFTGNQAPAIRSAVMASAVFAGMALGRRADALNSLAAATLLRIAYDPSSVARKRRRPHAPGAASPSGARHRLGIHGVPARHRGGTGGRRLAVRPDPPWCRSSTSVKWVGPITWPWSTSTDRTCA